MGADTGGRRGMLVFGTDALADSHRRCGHARLATIAPIGVTARAPASAPSWSASAFSPPAARPAPPKRSASAWPASRGISLMVEATIIDPAPWTKGGLWCRSDQGETDRTGRWKAPRVSASSNSGKEPDMAKGQTAQQPREEEAQAGQVQEGRVEFTVRGLAHQPGRQGGRRQAQVATAVLTQGCANGV